MDNSQNNNLQKKNTKITPKARQFVFALIILAIIASFSWIVWETYQADNFGFKGKTLWDWMELLVVPFVLALLVFLLNKSQKDTELKIAELRRTEDRESAEQRANVDREIEKDRQRQKALEDYLDRMTELLLENKLRESLPTDEIRSIARTRTLTILQSLDGARKSQLIQFLYESSLIGKISEQGVVKPIIDLSFADLQNIEIKYGKLEGIDLSKANLRNTNLQMTSLIGANFYLADLDDSDFSWTKLMGANLHAGLRRIDLSSANLESANVRSANLCGARLWHTNFQGADLQYANFMFNHPILRNKDNLEPATLMNVNFTGANLTKALISSMQLLGTQSLSGTILPNGQLFEEWKKKHNLRDRAKVEFDTFDNLESIFGLLGDEGNEDT
jgi:uncharacterized protein YjbI with pentapeptide repeats